MNTRRTALLLVILTVCVLLSAPAGAEVVGRTYDGFIHRYTADNGQDV